VKITLLGTGTSQGIPVIGCECDVCASDDVRDDRLRSGVSIEASGINLLIDTGPDLRQQILRSGLKRIDAILYTHEHNDHVAGLDDIRPFNFMQKADMPFFGLSRVLQDIEKRFAYVFEKNPYPGSPRATLNPIEPGNTFFINSLEITPIEVMHGHLPILGFRIGDFSFITDVSSISMESKELIKGSKVLVISALRKEKHHSHFNLQQAIDVVLELKIEKAYLTHISHMMGKTKDWEKELPPNIYPAFDGLEIELR
jgi:phosphoribosyl 1,2-cyclic phosphate phosphodiesterase